MAKLRQVLILRKLRIPLKYIREILKDPHATAAIGIFEKNIAQLDLLIPVKRQR